MSPTYLSPGVYVEEVDRGTKPIEAVGTAVAAFVGYSERAEDDGASLLGKPTLVTNWSQYIKKFGGFIKGAFMPDAVYGYFNNGGGNCYIVSVKTLGVASGDGAGGKAAAGMLGSGGEKPTDVLKITAKAAGSSGNNITVTAKPDPAAEGKDQTFTLNVSVGGRPAEAFEGLTLKKGENGAEAVTQKSKLINVEVVAKGTAATAVVPAGTINLAGGEVTTKAVTINDYQGSLNERTGLGGLEALDDVTMLIAPDLMTDYVEGKLDAKGLQGIQSALIDFCERVRYCFAILDTPPHLNPQQAKEWRLQVNFDSTRAAMYYPWIEVLDPVTPGKTKWVPPSGHMAGVYGRVDGTRGVHKAPANEIVRGALGLEVNATKGEHDTLNPIGVNVIRSFPGRGIRIWGARTLSSDASWRYINVRRLFSMVEASIERGTQWAVFEPNDQMLWSRIRRDISAFLTIQWRNGALFGATSEQAYYVKCDEELNPPETRDLGMLICDIGIAPVKPAEFVIMRISQWSGDTA